MAKVSTLADTNQKSISELSSEALTLSITTGTSASELGESLYEVLSAGISTVDLTAFLIEANKLAVVGFTDVVSSVYV